MDLHEVECKLMEVRKYSAEYYDVDAKFRRPELQLITAYNVQVRRFFSSYSVCFQFLVAFEDGHHRMCIQYFSHSFPPSS